MNYFNIKKIGLGLVAVIIILQFIRPTKNEGIALAETDILHLDSVSADVQKILKTSCYDCHSNHTTYPWYTNIQPLGLWMQWHVNEGKEELNFSEFKTYKPKRQKHKFEEISEVIEEDEMPLWSYTMIHTETKLSAEQKSLLTDWAKAEFEKITVPAP
ncbi:MAG: heme-binding domain-containing protein [Bacteroidia bacterium]|nr:heme-binding domain-containing protein [Bacteroidia bacterium]